MNQGFYIRAFGDRESITQLRRRWPWILLGALVLVCLVYWDAYNPQSQRGLQEIESIYGQINFPRGVSLDQDSLDHKTGFGYADFSARYHSSVPRETIYAYLDAEFAQLGWVKVGAPHPTYRKGPYLAQFYSIDQPLEGAYQLSLVWDPAGNWEIVSNE